MLRISGYSLLLLLLPFLSDCRQKDKDDETNQATLESFRQQGVDSSEDRIGPKIVPAEQELSTPADLHYVVLPLKDSQKIYAAKSDSSEMMDSLNMGEFRKVLHFDDKWIGVESSDGIGYLPRAQCHVTSLEHVVGTTVFPGLKNLHDLWFEVWSQSLGTEYEHLLRGLPDSTTITRAIDAGYDLFLSSRPLGLEILLQEIERARKADWYVVQALWDSVARIYPDYHFMDYGPAKLLARFQRAEVFAEYLHLPDSAYAIYLEITTRFPGIPIDAYEWNSQSDVWAFSRFLDLAKSQKMPDSLLNEYYDKFLDARPSPIVRAIVRLHKNPFVLKSDGYETVEKVWKSIITGPPLSWTSFKTSGEIRAAAFWQWQESGATVISKGLLIEQIGEFSDQQSDPFLLWVGNLILAELQAAKGDTSVCRERYEKARLLGSFGYVSIALLPGNDQGPYLSNDLVAAKLKTPQD